MALAKTYVFTISNTHRMLPGLNNFLPKPASEHCEKRSRTKTDKGSQQNACRLDFGRQRSQNVSQKAPNGAPKGTLQVTKIVPRRGFWPSLDRPYTRTRKFHQQIRERLPHGPKQKAQITTKLARTAKNPASPHSTRVSKNIEVRRCRASVLNNK